MTSANYFAGSPGRVAAKALMTGDTVVLVDRAARTDLRVALTAKLSERAEYAALRKLIDFWHERAAGAGRNDALSYGGILARMKGTRITTAGTIGNWIRGLVDGPADGDDVARFAQAIGDDLLFEQAQQVVWALRTLHSVNRKVGYWLSVQIAAATTRTADTVVDAGLDLHVADLLEAVSEHRIVDVDHAVLRAPISAVGVLLTVERLAEITGTQP